jgi:ArsR family transcriptional regulator, arsenate/arsenite/antimonite-responsive transcriptional repressor
VDAATALDMTPVATDDAVALLATVADPVRWRVLRLLASGQACVCEIQEQVPVASNLLSYHLRVLREAGLITSSKRGRWVDYRLAPGAGAALTAALPVGASVQP